MLDELKDTVGLLIREFLHTECTFNITATSVKNDNGMLVWADATTATAIHNLFVDVEKDFITQLGVVKIIAPNTYFADLAEEVCKTEAKSVKAKEVGYANRAEAVRQKEIIEYLKSRDDVFHFKIHQQSYYTSTRGIADILVVYKGLFIALEVKSKTGRLSGHQKLFKKNILFNGGIFAVVRCVEEVVKVLETANTKLVKFSNP